MKHTILIAAMALAVIPMTSACGGAVDDAEDIDPGAGAGEEVYTVTVVDLDQGGIVVSQRTVTRAQQLEHKRAQEELAESGLGESEQAIQADGDCIGRTPELTLGLFRMWDQWDYTGNLICFSGTGIADLSNYCRVPAYGGGCLDHWDMLSDYNSEPRSFKFGANYAYFYRPWPGVPDACSHDCIGYWSAWQSLAHFPIPFGDDEGFACGSFRYLERGGECTP